MTSGCWRFITKLLCEAGQQALAISRSLKEAEALVKEGETNAAQLTELVHNAITAAGGRVDYVEVEPAHPFLHCWLFDTTLL